MNYYEFVCKVCETLNERCAESPSRRMHASLHTALKNNGTERTGLVIETPGLNFSPTIYLESFYEEYKNGETVGEVTRELIGFCEDISGTEPVNGEQMKNFDALKDRIVFKLINTQKNSKLLEEIPHRDFLDLSIVYYVLLEANSDGTAVMQITDEHARRWGITPDGLWELAAKNSRRLLAAEFFTMNYVMSEMMGITRGEKPADHDLLQGVSRDEDKMYVLSNRMKQYGAACLAYPGIAEQIGEILGEDYYILPSSIHEVVIVPASAEIPSRDMNRMIVEINEQQVPEEEILGDHAYRYLIKSKEMAALLFVEPGYAQSVSG